MHSTNRSRFAQVAAVLFGLAAVACGPSITVGASIVPGITPLKPERARFEPRSVKWVPGVLKSSHVSVTVIDERGATRRDTASSPALAFEERDTYVPLAFHREFQSALERLFAILTANSGPVLDLQIQVDHATAQHSGRKRMVAVSLNLRFSVGDNEPFLVDGLSAGYELTGAPFDLQELDSMYRATCLQAVVDFLRSASGRQKINRYLRSCQPPENIDDAKDASGIGSGVAMLGVRRTP